MLAREMSSKKRKQHPNAAGGFARAKAMTPQERSESARHAITTRWARDLERRAREAQERQESQ